LVGYLNDAIDDTINELEPTLKAELIATANPMLDYLVGEWPSFSVAIPLEPLKQTLRANLYHDFVESPPPELAVMPPATREQYFNQLYQQFSQGFPSTFELDESLLGTEVPTQIAEGLSTAEAALAEARQPISNIRLTYKLLIGFMLLLILGIVLISRQVKYITRSLGTTFLTYGVLEYAGIFAGKYFAGIQLARTSIPPSLQEWLPQFISDFMAPLEIFSLALLIGGIVLIIVSFVYKRGQSSP
ncbi:hypothetical protein ACFLVH_06605, partial [Chloroflexota bacterium]